MKAKKEIQPAEEIECSLCKMPIDLKDEFCEFIHFKQKKEIKSIGFYHITCFRERMAGGQGVKELQAKANKILDAIGYKAGVAV